jgi:hypothetical protein
VARGIGGRLRRSPTGLRGLGGGGGGGAAEPLLAFLSGFVATTNYVATATGGSGSDAFSAWCIVIVRAVPSANHILTGRTPGTVPSVSGWGFCVNSIAQVTFQVRDSVGAKASPAYTIVAGDVGKAIMFHGWFDAAGTVVGMAKAGVSLGTTPTVGSLVTGGTAHGIGGRNGGNVSVGSTFDIAGAGYNSDTVITAPEMAAHYADAVALARCPAPSMSGTIRNWDVASYAAPSWPDTVAAQVQTVTGTLTADSTPPGWT